MTLLSTTLKEQYFLLFTALPTSSTSILSLPLAVAPIHPQAKSKTLNTDALLISHAYILQKVTLRWTHLSLGGSP